MMKRIGMKIKRIVGREIFDSRGIPTLEVALFLEDGQYVTASVPSGLSRGSHEAVELRDGGSRLFGFGLTKVIDVLDKEIAPLLLEKEPDLVTLDLEMIARDGTNNKANLGANTILASSIAIAKAQALSEGVQPYELIARLCNVDSVSMPYPFLNVINGGVHADNMLHVQEFMIVPVNMPTFRAAMESAVVLFHELKEVLHEHNKSTAVGDEGGFAPECESETEAFDYLMEAIGRTKQHTPAHFVIAIDVAASQFYDKKTKKYEWYGAQLSADDLIALYAQWITQYPIYAIEDGLAEDDTAGWQCMMKQLSNTVQLVGDDLFATNPERIWQGIEQKLATAVIIKPNQIGTVTEALKALTLCKENGLNTICSHRSGETNDSFIAEFALGSNAGMLKAGGCSRGERLAKYNQLMRIEDALVFSAMNPT
jgi:enolase